MAKGLTAEAIPHFQRVRPLNLETRFNLTRAYLRAGRTAEGLKVAKELSAQNKDDVQLHFTLGVCWPLKNSTGLPSLSWKGPTHCSRRRWRFSTTLGRPIFGAANTRKPNPLEPGAKTEARFTEVLYLMARVYSEQTKPVDALDLLARATSLPRRMRTSSFCWLGSACLRITLKTQSLCWNQA